MSYPKCLADLAQLKQKLSNILRMMIQASNANTVHKNHEIQINHVAPM
jgi:hypothetical protein